MRTVVKLGSESIKDSEDAELCSISWSRRKSRTFDGSGTPLRIVDLFCGCGGLTLGAFEAAKLLGRKPMVVLAADLHLPSLEVYRSNFKVSNRIAQEVDIQLLVDGQLGEPLTQCEQTLVDSIERPDLLVAGPPCQGHSDLNNRTRRNDPRNDLYLRAVRFVEITQPEYVLIENVPGAAHDKRGVVQAAETHLNSLGYSTQVLLVSGPQIGLPQLRKRLVLLASREAKDFPVHLPDVDSQASLSEWIGDLQREYLSSKDLYRTPSKMTARNKKRADYLYENDIYDLPNEQRPSCHRDKAHSYNAVYGRLHWNTPAPTITTGFGCMGQGRFLHPQERRVITPHEAARIQTFPDFFEFSAAKSRVDLQSMIGNAVPPKMAAIVLFSLMSTRGINVSA